MCSFTTGVPVLARSDVHTDIFMPMPFVSWVALRGSLRMLNVCNCRVKVRFFAFLREINMCDQLHECMCGCVVCMFLGSFVRKLTYIWRLCVCVRACLHASMYTSRMRCGVCLWVCICAWVPTYQHVSTYAHIMHPMNRQENLHHSNMQHHLG
jgi:hypothetical protein